MLEEMRWWLWVGTGLILLGMAVYVVGRQLRLSDDKMFQSWAPSVESYGFWLEVTGMVWLIPPHWYLLATVAVAGWLYRGWRQIATLPRVVEMPAFHKAVAIILWPVSWWLPITELKGD